MRKIVLALLMAAMLVFSCVAGLAEEAADENICTYVVWNETGELVTELYLIDNASGEKGENYAGEEGLASQASVEIKGENYDGYVKTLAFKTESGYEAAFATLHFENVPISLLRNPVVVEGDEEADAVTSATPINFFVPVHTAFYNLVNLTGEKVVEITCTDNATGEVIAKGWEEADGIEALAADESLLVCVDCNADVTKDLEMTLKFVTESGYTGEFKTLHFENVTINLLSADAMTGVTQIAFTMDPPIPEE